MQKSPSMPAVQLNGENIKKNHAKPWLTKKASSHATPGKKLHKTKKLNPTHPPKIPDGPSLKRQHWCIYCYRSHMAGTARF